MSDQAISIGGVFVVLGFGLNVLNPQMSSYIGVNLGAWGIFFVIVGLVVIGNRLRSM